MLSKRYESTEVDRRTWLHVPTGTLWSTSSDTHQVVEKTFLMTKPKVFAFACEVFTLTRLAILQYFENEI